MYGVVLILVLVIVGGLIAFIGDRLGSKVGKRKMSLFGLRPRYTSIIVTIVTGVSITTITFGILAITSKNVRTALFGMEKLQQRMQLTQQDLGKADNALDDARQKQKQMQDELKNTTDALTKARQQTQQLKEDQDKLLADNETMEMQNAQLANRNDILTGTNGKLQTYNDSLQQNNNKLQGQNADLVKRNDDLRSKRIVYQAGELIFGGVIPATTQREMAQNNLNKLVTMANTRISGMIDGKQSYGGLWIYPDEFENAVQKICGADTNMVVRFIAAANLVNGEPVRSNIELYPDKIVYQGGDMITTDEFVMTGNQNEAQQTLLAFLNKINVIASNNGILPDPLRGSIGVISMEQLYTVTESMAQNKGRIRLTAYSDGNTDTLGPLRLILKVDVLGSSNE